MVKIFDSCQNISKQMLKYFYSCQNISAYAWIFFVMTGIGHDWNMVMTNMQIKVTKITVLHYSFWLSNLGFSLNIMENKTFLHFQNYVQMLHNINILVAGNISDYEIFSVTTKMSIIFSCWRISIDLIWPKQKCSC